MEQGTKEFNEQQITKIQKAVRKAKYSSRKVVGYLAGKNEYYFEALTTIRRASLISAILWTVLSVTLSLGSLLSFPYIISSLQIIQNNTKGMTEADVAVFGVINTFISSVVVVLFIVVPIVMSILSIKAFKFKLSPSRLNKYFIWNFVLNSVWSIVLLPWISAIFSWLALIDIKNYRDWFTGFGKKDKRTRTLDGRNK